MVVTRAGGGEAVAAAVSNPSAMLNAELAVLVEETRLSGAGAALHVVAFSGGVDSSLAAYLVHRAFNTKNDEVASDATRDEATTTVDGTATGNAPAAGVEAGVKVPVQHRAVAAIGVSPALPASQLATAREAGPYTRPLSSSTKTPSCELNCGFSDTTVMPKRLRLS